MSCRKGSMKGALQKLKAECKTQPDEAVDGFVSQGEEGEKSANTDFPATDFPAIDRQDIHTAVSTTDESVNDFVSQGEVGEKSANTDITAIDRQDNPTAISTTDESVNDFISQGKDGEKSANTDITAIDRQDNPTAIFTTDRFTDDFGFQGEEQNNTTETNITSIGKQGIPSAISTTKEISSIEESIKGACMQEKSEEEVQLGRSACALAPQGEGQMTTAADTLQLTANSTAHIKQDAFTAISTTEGDVSYRNSKAGSWFVQVIIFILANFAYKKDLTSLMRLVTKLVTKLISEKGDKQVCEMRSTMPKDFYFFPGSPLEMTDVPSEDDDLVGSHHRLWDFF